MEDGLLLVFNELPTLLQSAEYRNKFPRRLLSFCQAEQETMNSNMTTKRPRLLDDEERVNFSSLLNHKVKTSTLYGAALARGRAMLGLDHH